MKKIILILISCLILTSCLAVGVPYTRDPNTLLAYAWQMHLEGRPMRMKEFLDQAQEKFLKRGDKFRLGDTYRMYGAYYLWHPEEAVIDPEPRIVTDRKQLEKSLDYYLKAFDLFRSLQKWGSLALTSAEIGRVYAILDDKDKAYSYFGQADKYYDKFLEDHTPDQFPYKLEVPNFRELIINYRKAAD